MLSIPFFYLGPMLTTPSHGEIIGRVWSILELPAFVIYFIARLDRFGPFRSSVMGEFANFVTWASVCWFIIGFLISLAARWAFRRLRHKGET
jgi:hypothetical protein